MATLTRSNKRGRIVTEGQLQMSAGANGNATEYRNFSVGIVENTDNGKTIHHRINVDRDEAQRIVDYLTRTLAERLRP